MNALLDAYVNNPQGYEENLNLGKEYKRQRQWSAAFSFLLRAAEHSDDPEEQYEALLLASRCFAATPSRIDTTKTLLAHCIDLLPKRPEAYFLLSQMYEWHKLFREGLTWSTLGLAVCDFSVPCNMEVDYSGKFDLLLEQSICLDWCDQTEKAKKVMFALTYENNMCKVSRDCVIRNLAYAESFEHAADEHNKYTANMHKQLRTKFPGSENITRNYAQVFQDLFVLTMNKGKRGMKYLEIGADDPIGLNNTYLLEVGFGWGGLSIERDKEDVKKWARTRAGDIMCEDALLIDYEKLLGRFSSERDYGYLQIDIDDQLAQIELLKRIPFDTYRFATITLEHDFYANNDSKSRDTMREYLISKGYVLAYKNISTIGTFAPFEDWFIHPALVDIKIEPLDSYGIDAKNIFIDASI